FKELVNAVLKSDARGRVLLGPLSEIVSVKAKGPSAIEHNWTLPTDAHTYRTILHAQAGQMVTVPYLGMSEKPAREELALFKLRDVSQFARVHVFATRYRPAYSPFIDLGKIRDAALKGFYPAHAESTYLTGRNIGDEYRYVLDRKTLPKFPGNVAERPALLLN